MIAKDYPAVALDFATTYADTAVKVHSVAQLVAAEASARQWVRHKDRVINPAIEDMSAKVRNHFKKVVTDFLALVKDRWIEEYNIDRQLAAETVPESELRDYSFIAIDENTQAIIDIAEEQTVTYVQGAVAFKTLAEGAADAGLSFNLAHPRAVAYLRDVNDRRIRDITDTTKEIIDKLVDQAVEEGMSYTQLAKLIRGTDGFDNQLFGRDVNGFDRADRIAQFEISDRYENGLLEHARQVQDAGFVVVKLNLTVGDSRVSEQHAGFEALSWVPIDFVYASGSTVAPHRPRCRCAMQYEVRTNAR